MPMILCPQCTTSLTLDPAQLAASQGWARCGQCHCVFDAAGLLLPTLQPCPQTPVDAPLLAAAPAPDERSSIVSPSENPPSPLGKLNWTHIDLQLDVPGDTTERNVQDEVNAPTHAEFSVQTDPRTALIQGTAAEPQWHDKPSSNKPQPAVHPQSGVAQRTDPLFIAGASSPAPFFAAPVVPPPPQPPLPARTRRPWRSVVWLGLGVILLLGLAAQIAHDQRDWLVARWPSLQPGLNRACAVLNCRIQPLRDLSALQLAHSAVVRLPQNRFQMDLELRNNSDLAVATPQLELSLQDSAGHTWSRRVLPLQLTGQPETLTARTRFTAQVDWQTSDPDAKRVDAYQVRLVYPES